MRALVWFCSVLLLLTEGLQTYARLRNEKRALEETVAALQMRR